jgi:hypothetical protein
MKKKILTIVLGLIILVAGSSWAGEEQTSDASHSENSAVSKDQEPSGSTVTPAEQPSSEAAVEAPEETGHSFGHMLLLYIPNRLLDVFDFARFRVRVGPGFAVGVRATKLVSAFAGGYSSLYVGLPGPRLKPVVKWPIGLENYAGVGLSVADATAGGNFGPDYSNTEIEVSVQAAIIGFDIGVDAVEVLDLALGFLFIDIRGDDF